MIGIYKITSPNNRVYIGQSIDMKNRIRMYKKNHCKKQSRLYNSIKKYGFNNHVFEVIEECNIEILNERERYWQDFYNVISKTGLNCRLTKTNDKSGSFSEETIKKMSAAQKNKIITIESRKKMSLAQLGKKRTIEHKLNMSIALKGRKHTEESKLKISSTKSKPILNTSTGIFYESTKEVCLLFGIKRGTLTAKLSGHDRNNTDFIYA